MGRAGRLVAYEAVRAVQPTVAEGVPAVEDVVATNPNVVLAPGASVPFHAASVTVVVPSGAVVEVPFQTWVSRAPAAGATVTVHPGTVAADVLVTVTSPW